MVTSKPKRISVTSGLVHIVILLNCLVDGFNVELHKMRYDMSDSAYLRATSTEGNNQTWLSIIISHEAGFSY